jgi:predicted Zn-dependent protease
MPLLTHPILRAFAWLSASILVTGCSSADSRAQAALGQYQAAAASNDMVGARNALLRLVQAKDDVAEYWADLGKVETSMGSYSDAYYAFTRAYELDRSNPELARMLTQLALRSGDLTTAQARAEELEVLAPGDPWVKLTKGWAAIGESRYDQAVQTAEELLVQTPLDPGASVLKGRALFGLGRDDEAIAFLTQHLQAIPTDTGALALLAQIYERRDDWANVAAVRQRLSQLKPDDEDNLVILVQASLRSGKIPQGRAASFRLLKADAPPTLVLRVLDLWTHYWPSPQRIEDAKKLASAAPKEQRLAYALFLSRLGSPADAIRLTANEASLPVKAENAEANAVLGDALSRTGNLPAAKSRLDAVIAYDPGNTTALRARAELNLRTGKTKEAVDDAQKLVTVLPTSADDRILLAKAFSAAGNGSWADRTLWAAFRDIPGNDSIYAALRSSKNGNQEVLTDLQSEFDRQRDAKVRKGLL